LDALERRGKKKKLVRRAVTVVSVGQLQKKGVLQERKSRIWGDGESSLGEALIQVSKGGLRLKSQGE